MSPFRFAGLFLLGLCAVGMAELALAQGPPPPPLPLPPLPKESTTTPPATRAPAGPVTSGTLEAAELERLVAKVATYPDHVLDQILDAAQHPVAIHQAAEMARTNAQQDGLDEVLQGNLPTSVNYLRQQHPEVLQELDRNLNEIAQLGAAMQRQPDDVFAAVRKVRGDVAQAENETQQPAPDGQLMQIDPSSDLPYGPLASVYPPYDSFGFDYCPTYSSAFYSYGAPGFGFAVGTPGYGYGYGYGYPRYGWGYGNYGYGYGSPWCWDTAFLTAGILAASFGNDRCYYNSGYYGNRGWSPRYSGSSSHRNRFVANSSRNWNGRNGVVASNLRNNGGARVTSPINNSFGRRDGGRNFASVSGDGNRSSARFRSMGGRNSPRNETIFGRSDVAERTRSFDRIRSDGDRNFGNDRTPQFRERSSAGTFSRSGRGDSNVGQNSNDNFGFRRNDGDNGNNLNSRSNASIRGQSPRGDAGRGNDVSIREYSSQWRNRNGESVTTQPGSRNGQSSLGERVQSRNFGNDGISTGEFRSRSLNSDSFRSRDSGTPGVGTREFRSRDLNAGSNFSGGSNSRGFRFDTGNGSRDFGGSRMRSDSFGGSRSGGMRSDSFSGGGMREFRSNSHSGGSNSFGGGSSFRSHGGDFGGGGRGFSGGGGGFSGGRGGGFSGGGGRGR